VVEAGNRPPAAEAGASDASGHWSGGAAADVDSDLAGSAVPGDAGAGGILLAESVLDRRYRLIGVLGSRGPVTLWRGDDTVLTRPVAVRVVEHSDEAGRREAAQSLLNAAVSSGRLVHPGAASTYDATVTTTDSGQVSYVITEWVDGRTLAQLVEEAPLRPEQAAAVVLGAARVIAAAHERGLRHGDLRPGDVIVSSHGTVKVVDLEVGAVLARLDGDRPTTGAEADTESEDVRALGGLLYAALTGCWPLGGDTGLPTAPYGTYGRLQSPRQLNHAVPRDLDAITMAALHGEDQADDPIASAAVLIEELEAVTPVEALHDTGLMAFGDEPPRTEEMLGYGPDTEGMQSTSGFAAPAPDGYRYGDEYDDAGPYQGEYRDQGYDQGGYGYGQRGYADEEYPRGYADEEYPRGYPPGPGGQGPRGGRTAAGQPRPNRRPMIIGGVLAVVLVVIVASILAVKLGGGNGTGAHNSPTASAPATAGTPINLTDSMLTVFNPGYGVQNDGMLPNLIDGNPSTQWTTDGYNLQASGAQFGGLKKGVGFKVTFPQAVHPSQVVITIGTMGPLTFELHAAPADGSTIDAFPEVGQPNTGNASQQVAIPIPAGLSAQYWVVWLTHLPQDPTNSAKLKGAIAEIKFLS
jgi:hypothetical protein